MTECERDSCVDDVVHGDPLSTDHLGHHLQVTLHLHHAQLLALKTGITW